MSKRLGGPLLAQLRDWLSAPDLPDDGRLPPERELADRFSVTRAELRKAFAVLEAEGRLRRHVGRGTFLTFPRGPSTSRVEEIGKRTTPRDAMQARMVVEPEMARLAALNATTAHIAEMRSLCARMRNVGTWGEYEELDARFHDLIAEATANSLLAEIHHIVNGVRRAVGTSERAADRAVG